jgi:type IV pilus assembly protein PilC
MAKYKYTAVAENGNPYSGTAEAKDEHSLAKILRAKGYVLVSANVENGKNKKMNFDILAFFGFHGVPLTEKIMFCRNVRIMINAGIALPKALQILSEQTKNKRFKNTLIEVKDDLLRGNSFSKSLGEHPSIFSELFCNMIKAGEETGTLENIFRNLTNQMEKEHELKSRIKGAMMYPAVILTAMVGIGILMLIVVVPTLSKTFEDMDIELPMATKIIINLGDFMAEQWYVAILIFAFLALVFKTLFKKGSKGKIMSYLILNTPIVGPVAKKSSATLTARTLSSLMASGIPIVRSLKIISNTMSNFYFRSALIDCSKKVEKGEKLSVALSPYENIFPSLIIQMIAVGEETGMTPETLSKIADFLEEEVANTTKNLSTVIEPVLMIVIGAAVGFFAISVIQPMYSMLSGI